MITRTHLILYVRDQATSTAFYQEVLGQTPSLNVPGMTEFAMASQVILGLMPEAGIRRLLGDGLPDPAEANGIPRAEVYLVVENPADYYARAIAAGATPLSELSRRDWGHTVAYCLDPDGHVLALAQEG